MNSRFLTALAVTVLCGTFSGCKKNVAAAPPPPPFSNGSASNAVSRSSAPQAPARSEAAANTQSRMPDEATRARIQDLLNRIQDAYFDYDKHTLRPDAQAALEKDAQTLGEILRQYPDYKLT